MKYSKLKARVKHITLMVMLVLFISSGCFGKTVQHTVMRGETLESIANQYGVPPESILTTNGVDKIYTGLNLTVQLPESKAATYTSQANLAVSEKEYELILKAERQLSDSKYGKAVKTYSKLIKISPKPEYYFNRGLAQFKRGKNRQCTKDMIFVMKSDDATEELKTTATELFEVADKRHEEWKKERGQFWGQLAVAVVGTGLQTWAAVESAKAYSDSDFSYIPSSYYSSSQIVEVPHDQIMSATIAQTNQAMADYNNTYNAIMNKTIMDVNAKKQQIINDYRQMCLNSGYTPSEEECEQAYYSYLSAQYENNDNIDSDNSSRTNSGAVGFDNSGNNTSTGSYPTKQCHICKGTGKCTACGGDKVAHGLGLSYYCKLCRDEGKCTTCNGTGEVYDNAAARKKYNDKVYELQHRKRP